MNISKNARLRWFCVGFVCLAIACFIPFYLRAEEGQKKRILWVDSYHQGYAWNESIGAGIKSVLADKDIIFDVYRMDTKRHTSEAFKKKAGLEAKAKIEAFKPDVVIASDDNAQKYLIVPYYKGGHLPVVFTGVNWSATEYGYPAANITGMIQVGAADELIKRLQSLADGRAERIGFIAADTLSERKSRENFSSQLGIHFARTAFVKTMADFKKAYLEMQKNVDILVFSNEQGIIDLDEDEVAAFVLAHTRIPSGAVNEWMNRYVVLVYAKRGAELGEWAASAALEILAGKAPADIPVARNVDGILSINVSIANKAKLNIPADLLEIANIVE